MNPKELRKQEVIEKQNELRREIRDQSRFKVADLQSKYLRLIEKPLVSTKDPEMVSLNHEIEKLMRIVEDMNHLLRENQ